MKPGKLTTQEVCNASARCEDVGDDLGAVHPLEHQHGVAALRRERPDDGGDVLVRRDLVGYDKDIIRVLGAVSLEEAVEILLYFSTPA
jgi:hypothetical protein